MQINAIILAALVVFGVGTLISQGNAKQITVNNGPGTSKFITVHGFGSS